MRLLLALLTATVAACSTAPICPPIADDADTVYVISRGWHVELGVDASSLTGPLAVYRQIFPTARAFTFGYGKRTFLTAPPNTPSEWILGPFPGPAVVQVTGLSKRPDLAFPAAEVTRLTLPPGGDRKLEDFIWHDIDSAPNGEPHLVGPGRYPGSLFYAARSGYSLLHTCNTWAADAVHEGGSTMTGDAVIVSGQVVERAITAGACMPLGGEGRK